MKISSPKPTQISKPKTLVGTTWAHKSLKEAGSAVGAQLPNQFIVKHDGKTQVALYQVGSLSPEPSFWNREDFFANFTQLPLA
jgi:hypothetical protein